MLDPASHSNNPSRGHLRIIIASLSITILVLGLAIVLMAIGKSPQTKEPPKTVNVLAKSKDSCVTCHRQATPGIVDQFSRCKMAAAEVTCRNCHETPKGYPGSVEHENTWVLPSPTPLKCQKCHASEVAQFYQSRHSAPAYAAMTGVSEFSETQIALYKSIPEGSFAPDKGRNALYAIEGEKVTGFACHKCHDIGKPHPDDSVGKCQKCHLRHEFSLEQARKPETCNHCHIGPDHPQYEIYMESPHGIATMTMGHDYNWDAEPGTLTVKDFPAPNCATCHISGFGAASTTHDVGERLTWYLFAPISERRPAWEDNKVRMQNVCRSCHNEEFINKFYSNADELTAEINAWVKESDNIAAALKAGGFMNSTPFDEPIDFTYFDLWHHWGRTAKFGAWMLGADYTQWHGAYEMLKELAVMRDYAREKLGADKFPLTNLPYMPSDAAKEGTK